MEDGRIGGKKLLVARNDEGGGEVYRWIQCMLKEQKSYGGSSRKADTKYDPRKTMETYYYRLYHQVTTGPGIQCNISSMWPVYKNGPFYCYYRKNISKRVGKAVLRPSIVAS